MSRQPGGEPSTTEPTDDLLVRHAELVGLLQAEESYEETLARMARLSCATIPGCTTGSVTLWRSGHPYTVSSTDDLARRVDEAQYDAGEGPCLDASRTGETYVVDDMTVDGRWPALAVVAVREGIRSSLSLPLAVNGRPLGALNLYSTGTGAFADAVAVGRLFAAQASVAIANAEVYHASRTLATQLEDALHSRAIIEQAKGIIMADQGCDADRAFEHLRTASQRENVKLREIAARIVASRAGRPAAT